MFYPHGSNIGWQGRVAGDGGEGKYLLSQWGKGSLLVPEEVGMKAAVPSS